MTRELPLALVHQLTIAPEVLQHQHVCHAQRILVEDLDSEVVKTNDNSRHLEVYGWKANVTPHRDHQGFVYITVLSPGETTIYVAGTYTSKDKYDHSLVMQQGDIVRLDDRLWHWTKDSKYRLALILGSYKRPNDRAAIAKITNGLEALKNGEVSAPNVIGVYRRR